jgi:transposase
MGERNMKKKHTDVETKLKAVRRVLENHTPIAIVAEDLDLHRDTVNRWVNAFKKEGEKGLMNPRSIKHSSPNKSEAAKIKVLEKQLKEKELEIEILKKFQAFLKENE